MMDYYFHADTKKIYSLLDSQVCYMWDDREKDLDLALDYYPIFDFELKETFIIDANDFEEFFIPIDENNFDEIHDDFGFDELTKQKIKKEMLKILKD